MQKTSKLLLSGVAGVAALVCCVGLANAAGRATTGNARAGATTARMPTMPTMSINTIGTHAVAGTDVPVVSGGNNGGGNVNPNPNPNPQPGPTPNPGTGCEDGGVENSSFTVDDCMQSILACVQGGTLPNGLNDLFNEDLRNSIMNGMGICANEIDKCIRQVRVDCHNVYDAATDVWLDFNSRVVQPEYYNFVLRKTGLTPNQAENVCNLLDKNTYGKSFAAVSGANGEVTSEYGDKVGAYNEQNNGSLSKAQPQGPMVNTTANGNNGVDGERGHYARWDATNAVCKVRVAAYNKDKLISNNWLFGAIGDDKDAEVWRDAGSTFTCNKDLFDFSLLNDTKTVAVVGMGGGTLVGAGIGALAGHSARDFKCGDENMRSELSKQIKDNGLDKKLNKFLSTSLTTGTLNGAQCTEILNLYERYMQRTKDVEMCSPRVRKCEIDNRELGDCATVNSLNPVAVASGDFKISLDGKEVVIDAQSKVYLDGCVALCQKYNSLTEPCRYTTLLNGSDTSGESNGLCAGGVATCVDEATIKNQIKELDGIFSSLSILQGQESNRLKTTLTGAGIGLATGGVATAITAFVERNNISCHVGDGLNVVGFGKSYTIDSLKDFYVKWNLRVADSISPTARVTSCQDWIDTCGMYTTPDECRAVEINYQRPGRNTTTLIRSACRMSGSVCIENRSVAVSYGACPRNGIPPVVPPVGPVNPGTQPSINVISH